MIMHVKNNTEQSYNRKIQCVRSYIQHNLDGNLSLEVLASIANVSKFHFHRVFHAVTGENLLQYTKRIRLENAAYQLSNTIDSITNIGLDVGYGSTSAFTKAFKKKFNCSPKEYRRKQILSGNFLTLACEVKQP